MAETASLAFRPDPATVLRQAIERIFNQGDFAAAEELIDPHYVNHDATPGQHGGPAGVVHVARLYRTAFPDLYLRIAETLVNGDRVVVRVEETGTHRGSFLGAAPTGRRVRWTWLGIYRVRQGRLVERWGTIESLDLLRQLGLVALAAPTPASTAGEGNAGLATSPATDSVAR